MLNFNWDTVEPAKEYAPKAKVEIPKLVAGAYICRIVRVEDNPEKHFLKIYFDIAEGEFKDYGANCEQQFDNDWNYPKIFAYYTENSKGLFSRLLHAIQDSNPGFKVANFNGNEQMLVGKLIGLVLDEKEYTSKNTGRTSIIVSAEYPRTYSVKNIRENKYRPAIVLNSPETANTEEKTVSFDELPF